MKLKRRCVKGVIAEKIVPAFCGTAFKNKGVQLVLDAVIDYLPSPFDRPPVVGINPAISKKYKLNQILKLHSMHWSLKL